MVRNRNAMFAGLAGVAIFTSVADATLTKFKDWMPEGNNAGMVQNVDGMALLRVGSDSITEMTLNLHGLQPNQAYAVQVCRDGTSTRNDVQAFSTNSQGKALYQASWFEGGVTGDPIIRVYVWDGCMDEFNLPDEIITNDEARAVSIPIQE
jgi:hypothetical protein